MTFSSRTSLRLEYEYQVMSWYAFLSDSYLLQDEMRWFFEGYTTQEDFEKDLAPALERGILRSPELILSGSTLDCQKLI